MKYHSLPNPGLAVIAVVAGSGTLLASKPGECAIPSAVLHIPTAIIAHDRTFWDLFQQGGFMMWVMLGVSMFALSLIIESAVKLRPFVIAPGNLYDQLKVLLAQNNYQEAWRASNAVPCPLGRVVAAGLEALGQGRDVVNETLEEHALQEAMMLKTRVNYLSVIGVVSPMLGLIGTVVGMIKAFQAIGNISHNPSVLAAAIGEVLVATAFGLFIAVPAFFAYYFFRNRAQAMIVLLQDRVTRLMKNLPYDDLRGIRIGDELEMQFVPMQAITDPALIPAAPAAVAAVNCPNCHNTIIAGTTQCPSCGVELRWN